jgi:AraC-like DNA-binding protein
MALAARALLAPRLPPPDATAALVVRIVQRAADDRGLTRVEDLAAAAGLGVRDLQWAFREHVGVSPKWVLRRYRLQEVAHRLASGQAVDLTRLAHDLGYCDHAHLTRDFRAMTGHSPAAYRAANAPPDATSARSTGAPTARSTSPAASRSSSPS